VRRAGGAGEAGEQGSRGRRILLGEPKCGQLSGFDISMIVLNVNYFGLFPAFGDPSAIATRMVKAAVRDEAITVVGSSQLFSINSVMLVR
jgi:hypothetical protein